MDAKISTAINAYGEALKQASGVDPKSKSSTETAFGNLLSETLDRAREGTANAEATEMKALAKEADLVDVVTALSNAELAVETVVAVRDRVIQAYNDIIKMPI